ncbi:hypothetical protein ACLOJK_027777 [Asimina triloba]
MYAFPACVWGYCDKYGFWFDETAAGHEAKEMTKIPTRHWPKRISSIRPYLYGSSICLACDAAADWWCVDGHYTVHFQHIQDGGWGYKPNLVQGNHLYNGHRRSISFSAMQKESSDQVNPAGNTAIFLLHLWMTPGGKEG